MGKVVCALRSTNAERIFRCFLNGISQDFLATKVENKQPRANISEALHFERLYFVFIYFTAGAMIYDKEALTRDSRGFAYGPRCRRSQ